MRLLVACPHCQRQFDASRRPIGSQFRCTCGQVVLVQRPEGHDAQVARCASCGAPRVDQSPRCAYCNAEFTLHERDLNTVCPHCLARVSDQARFCHHCGTGLVPEQDAGTDTKLLCPACQDGHRLTSRRLGAEQVTVLECSQCAGFWMGHEAFRQFIERAKQQALPSGTTPESPLHEATRFGLPAGAAAVEKTGHGSFYRPCPVCGRLTNRVNYGHASGVIVDICKDHGIWFDADELARILTWLRAGGDQRPVRDDGSKAKADNALLRIEHSGTQPRQSFVGALLESLFGLS